MFLAQYWAVALAEQNEDAEMKAVFSKVAQQLKDNEVKILAEINYLHIHMGVLNKRHRRYFLNYF